MATTKLRIKLFMFGQQEGELVYLADSKELTGEIKSLKLIRFPRMKAMIWNAIASNEHGLYVMGGHKPEDLAPYLEGVLKALTLLSQRIIAFSFDYDARKIASAYADLARRVM